MVGSKSKAILLVFLSFILIHSGNQAAAADFGQALPVYANEERSVTEGAEDRLEQIVNGQHISENTCSIENQYKLIGKKRLERLKEPESLGVVERTAKWHALKVKGLFDVPSHYFGRDSLKDKERHTEAIKGPLVARELLKDDQDSFEREREIPVQTVKQETVNLHSKGSGCFAWPADGGFISNKQGRRQNKLHKGIDIARPNSAAVMAADHGTVEFAGDSGGYGNKVMIDHHNGYKTVYGHLYSIKAKEGQTISKGMEIGRMGSTGHSTGVHLHFEVYKNEILANPLDYISH